MGAQLYHMRNIIVFSFFILLNLLLLFACYTHTYSKKSISEYICVSLIYSTTQYTLEDSVSSHQELPSQGFSTFWTFGPVDKFFKIFGHSNFFQAIANMFEKGVVYFDQLLVLVYSKAGDWARGGDTKTILCFSVSSI